MKKIHLIGLVSLLILPLSSCGNKDSSLLDKYLKEKFSKEQVFDTLIIGFSSYETVSSVRVKGLKGIYTVDYSYDEFSDNLSMKNERAIELDYRALSKDNEYTDSVEVECYNISLNFKKKYTIPVRAKTYIHYLPSIYYFSGDYDRYGELGFVYTSTSVSSGHFYKTIKHTVDMENRYFEYYKSTYEKDIYGIHNQVTNIATYYFDNNPRIVSNAGEIYYENQFNTLIENEENIIGISLSSFKKLNQIFTYYNDTQYMTSIS